MSNIKYLPTRWSDINKALPLNDYPRPQMVRDNWANLNGEWLYSTTDEPSIPTKPDGNIIVPFSPESELSGATSTFVKRKFLWYRRYIETPIMKEGERLILHFGAVDQNCFVYCNRELIGTHKGGYLPFSFEITNHIGKFPIELLVCVTDDTDKGDEAYGKQSSKRGGIWYTPTCGIWQTVWTEVVPKDYIKDITITPLFDESAVAVSVEGKFKEVSVSIIYEDKIVSSIKSSDKLLKLKLKKFTAWTPENPYLYDLIITTDTDEVRSYFGMRKFSCDVDKNGHKQFYLNNKPYFQSGLLDQGYWSDGLYTAASDEAFSWEIKKLKSLGFNMLRKHIKIEPLRWYYHCDRLGMLVWQDAVSGGNNYKKSTIQVLPFIGLKRKDSNYEAFGRSSKNGRIRFKEDMTATMELLKNVTSLCTWVPFNEGWGQFDAKEMYEYVKDYDDTRLVDHASGWHDQGSGDFNSVHVYYKKFKMKKDKLNRIQALTEFGGYSCPLDKKHMSSDTLFGYRMYDNIEDLSNAIDKLYRTEVLPQIKDGLAVTIYTQVSDVEDEINGIFSYDREIVKVDDDIIKQINKDLKEEFERCRKS